MIHNVNVTKARDLKDAYQFNPYCQPPAVAAAPVDWSLIHADFEARRKSKA